MSQIVEQYKIKIIALKIENPLIIRQVLHTGRLESNNTQKEVEIAMSSEHLRNFWRTLDI